MKMVAVVKRSEERANIRLHISETKITAVCAHNIKVHAVSKPQKLVGSNHISSRRTESAHMAADKTLLKLPSNACIAYLHTRYYLGPKR